MLCLQAPVDIAMQPAHSALQPVPIIEVAFKQGKWWSLPPQWSQFIYEQYVQGNDAGYTWDWEGSRIGSWVHDNQETSINRYLIDLKTMKQTNIDNGRLRSVRIIWLDPAAVEPVWTGTMEYCVLNTAMLSAPALVDIAIQPAHSALQPVPNSLGQVPILEVAYGNDMWWTLPQQSWHMIYEKYLQSETAVYTWNRENYEIDFQTMTQRDMHHNDRLRSIRIAWLDPAAVEPVWTGTIPK